jgi:putative ABC transport system permease protein
MFKNYFKIAIRNLSRDKIYSFINIAGLSIGLAGCLLVANVVIDDLSYDKQWGNADHIYRVISNNKGTGESIPVALSGLGPALEKNFPEVENYCRIGQGNKTFSQNNSQEKFEVSCLTTEASFLNIFNFTFLQGSPQTAENGYYNVIITEAVKEKYFPDINPLGKHLQNILTTGEIDSSQYIITGVIKEFPYNSHLRAEAIVLKPFSNQENELTERAGRLYPLYVLLRNGTDPEQFATKVNRWYKTSVSITLNTANFSVITNSFQPLSKVYLHSDFAKTYQPVIGSIRNVYIFSVVAIVLLLIACFNFINLTTAKALKRVAETSVRKVLGANKFQLIYQFLIESLLFFVISFILALFLYQLSIKPIEAFIGHSLTVSLVDNLKLLCFSSGVVFLVCIFTGLYPALILAGTKAALALKGNSNPKSNNNLIKKSLVVGQFTISIVIVIAAIVVKEQLSFLNTADLGYDKNNLLQISYTNWGNSGSTFKQKVKDLAGVENASIARWLPGKGGGSMSMEVDDPTEKNKKINVWFIDGDIDFAQTLKLQLEKGRLLNSDFSADELNTASYFKNKELDKLADLEAHQSVLVTSYAAKILATGEFKLNQPLKIPGVAVGIVNDFHNESLKTVMKPCVIKADNNIAYGSMLVRIRPGAEKKVINSINTLWSKFYPSQPLQYDWVSDALQNQYKAEKKIEQLFFFFSYLTVFLACLGLFGLISFTTELRRKEIGIRKVLGASAAVITSLISRDFLKLVIIAIVIASPIAYFIMNKWLEDYAYRINISWWMLTTAGVIGLLIALITISFQAIKAAIANPVKSLRTE